jgi:hypothetical protein
MASIGSFGAAFRLVQPVNAVTPQKRMAHARRRTKSLERIAGVAGVVFIGVASLNGNRAIS